MKYRPEIDGLRAIAVVPVILFHAGLDLFGGGFIGVDIFFVISGFLITSILIDDIEAGTFSIIKFYERRIRRILPALVLVMIVCVPFAFVWMMPGQMEDFSRSLMAVSVFSSNILFWRTFGYFAPAAEELPLLHTWSLAVEEQYYVFFPIFLAIAWRFGRKAVFWLLVVFATGSLVLSEMMQSVSALANFYLTPTRAWELFAGSLSAFAIGRFGVRSNDILATVGLLAVTIPIFAFDANTPFPGLYALIPVLGVVLLIIFAGEKTFAARFLRNKVFVGIGLISYSAYLWHQPLFAFARIKSFEEPDHRIFLTLSLLAMALAYLSWRFVEAPFRNPAMISRRTIFILTPFLIGVPFLIGAAGHFTNGFSDLRFSKAQSAALMTAARSPKMSECLFDSDSAALYRKPCRYGGEKVSVAVVGNSHASELAFAISELLNPYNIGIAQFSITGCRHNYGVDRDVGSVCQRWHQQVMDRLKADDDITHVVLSYRNEKYIAEPLYRSSLIRFIQELIDHEKEVTLVLQAPTLAKPSVKYVQHKFDDLLDEIIGRSRSDWRNVYAAGVSALVAELPPSVHVADPANLFCDEENCFVARAGNIFYYDDSHMSVTGARLVGETFFENLLEP